MKTYTAKLQSGSVLFEKKNAQEIWNLIPPGAKIVQGDIAGKSQAIFEMTNGMKFILTEDKND